MIIPQQQLEQLFLEHQKPEVRQYSQEGTQLSRPGGAGGTRSLSLRQGLEEKVSLDAGGGSVSPSKGAAGGGQQTAQHQR